MKLELVTARSSSPNGILMNQIQHPFHRGTVDETLGSHVWAAVFVVHDLSRGRMTSDRAQYTVMFCGTVFFGNSVDGKVYALDAEMGIQKWAFFTDGPIRFVKTAAVRVSYHSAL